jgi:hypothetical protein
MYYNSFISRNDGITLQWQQITTVKSFITLALGVNFTNIFGAKEEELLRRKFSRLLMATAFSPKVPKYGA